MAYDHFYNWGATTLTGGEGADGVLAFTVGI